MNPVAERFTGWSEAEARGRGIGEVFHIVNEESQEVLEDPVQRVLREGTVVGLANHTVLIARDATERPIADSSAPIQDDSGAVIGVVLVFHDQTAERKSRRELKEREQLLEETGRMARVGGWELDADSSEVRWTEETYRIHEVPLTYRPSLNEAINFFHSDDRPKLTSAIQDALEHGIPYDMEIRFITATGKQLWTRSICKPEIVEGKTVRLRGTFQDITERRKAEEALRQSEQRYRRLHETMTDAFVQVDMSGLITDFNTAYQEMLGYQPEELRRLTYPELTPEKWHDIEARIVSEKILPFGQSGVYEKEYIRKDGSVFPVELRTFLITDEEGKPTAMWAIVRDITERKKAEEALLESEKKFRLLYEEAPIPYQSLDEEGRLLEVNTAWLRLLGYTRDEVLGKSFIDFLTPASRERFVETFAGFKRAGHIHGVEHEMICKKGRVIDVSIDGRISLGKDEAFEQTHCVFQDITQRKQAAEAIRLSEEKYRTLFEQATDAILIVRPKGKIIDANQSCAELFGAPIEEIKGANVIEYYENTAARAEFRTRTDLKGFIKGFPWHVRRRDGSVRHCILNSSVWRDLQGQVLGYISIAHRRQLFLCMVDGPYPASCRRPAPMLVKPYLSTPE